MDGGPAPSRCFRHRYMPTRPVQALIVARYRHRGTAECRCTDDECVEVPWHDTRANYGAEDRKNKGEHTAGAVVPAEHRRQCKPDRGTP